MNAFIINTNDQRMLNGLAKKYYLNRMFKNLKRVLRDSKYEEDWVVRQINQQKTPLIRKNSSKEASLFDKSFQKDTPKGQI